MTRLLEAIGWDLVTGRPSGLPATIRRAVRALERAEVRYAVTNGIALGARGYVRTTLDLDLLVSVDDLGDALAALTRAGFTGASLDEDEPEPQYVLDDPKTDATVDLLVGFGEPELSLLRGATRVRLGGLRPRVARPEHLLLSYLYSNQPRHLGDFASLVQGGKLDRAKVRALLGELHPEMLATFDRRWRRPSRRPRRRARRAAGGRPTRRGAGGGASPRRRSASRGRRRPGAGRTRPGGPGR